MKYGCPNPNCKYHQKTDQVCKSGTYYRRCDHQRIQTYRCNHCGKKFSSATFSLAKGQLKRKINCKVKQLLCSGVSQRRIAKLLKINRGTVKRKLIYLAKKANVNQKQFLEKLKKNKVKVIYLDDLITIEHTKLKPLSVSVAITEQRKFLAVEVSTIAASGLLAKDSVKKYGLRPSQHRQGLERVFQTIAPILDQDACLKSDEHKLYPALFKKYFSKVSTHCSYKSKRSCVAGQGELKTKSFDPLFSINHTLAMMRANINRLFRRTWCTTKDPKMLKCHIDVYMDYHNTELL